MLIATAFSDALGTGICVMMMLLVLASYYWRKFCDANPEVEEAAKKALATKAMQLINRWFK
jgi:hypothetical protein